MVASAVPWLTQAFLPWMRFALDCDFLNQNIFCCDRTLRSDRLAFLLGLCSMNVSDGCQHCENWKPRLT